MHALDETEDRFIEVGVGMKADPHGCAEASLPWWIVSGDGLPSAGERSEKLPSTIYHLPSTTSRRAQRTEKASTPSHG